MVANNYFERPTRNCRREKVLMETITWKGIFNFKIGLLFFFNYNPTINFPNAQPMPKAKWTYVRTLVESWKARNFLHVTILARVRPYECKSDNTSMSIYIHIYICVYPKTLQLKFWTFLMRSFLWQLTIFSYSLFFYEFNSRRKFLNDFCCQQNDKTVKFSITESTYRIMCVCIRVCKYYLGSSQNPSPNT